MKRDKKGSMSLYACNVEVKWSRIPISGDQAVSMYIYILAKSIASKLIKALSKIVRQSVKDLKESDDCAKNSLLAKKCYKKCYRKCYTIGQGTQNPEKDTRKKMAHEHT